MRSIRSAAAVSAVAAMALGSAAPALAAESAVAANPNFYSGKTSQNQPISFSIKSGKVKGEISWKASCGSKGTLAAGTNFKAKLSRGKFKVHGSYQAAIRNTPYTGHFTVTLPGTVSGSRAHGTFHATVELYEGSHKAGSCNSGKVTWHAKKR